MTPNRGPQKHDIAPTKNGIRIYCQGRWRVVTSRVNRHDGRTDVGCPNCGAWPFALEASWRLGDR